MQLEHLVYILLPYTFYQARCDELTLSSKPGALIAHSTKPVLQGARTSCHLAPKTEAGPGSRSPASLALPGVPLCSFDCSNVLDLAARLAPEEKQAFDPDPRRVDWRSYLRSVYAQWLCWLRQLLEALKMQLADWRGA